MSSGILDAFRRKGMKEARKVGEKLYKNLVSVAFPGDSVVKNLPVNAGDVSSVPGLGRSSGEGNGNPL